MRILVATDGKPASLGAARFAVALDQKDEAEVRVLRVMQPVPLYASADSPIVILPSAPAVGNVSPDIEEESKELIREAGPETENWTLTIEIGPPPPTIVRVAGEFGADLIITGLGRHELRDRWLGTETALRVAQISHIPVIAVPSENGPTRPRGVVVAVDFSAFARDALATALRVAEPGTTIHLVHVLDAGEGQSEGPEDWRAHEDSVRRALRDWARDAPGAEHFRFEFHSPYGNPVARILELASELNAELIAAGSHGSGFFARAMLGSVSTRLLRATDRALLITPPRAPSREIG
ncbi:MAG: universal stress protein [Gemmatimonadota bacterium]|jgi:nucleotide-binding universal stress UspA family protein|nr:universal stress protein [Gemmatimonadota bacterium]